MDDCTSVKVALRIRPQIPREVIDMCHVCTSVSPGDPQVWLGKDKAFTFDHVYDMATIQDDVYESCVKSLVDGCFEGYNATVLAYGQTGSGKTYTMGTGFDLNLSAGERGIIPRAVEHLFNRISEIQRLSKEMGETPPEFKVNTQFMELYNEEIIDLLDSAREIDDKGKKSHIKIHEDSLGGIYTVGVTTRSVVTAEETLHCLKIGALSRTTASTQMNVQSSRSHAIFTLHIKQQRVVRIQQPTENGNVGEEPELHTSDEQGLNEFETLTAKFHFVDLAGSERLKRTGATGERAKEGISINCGLLSLGNVISALGDKSRRVSHVPYRDSKLTRLLQDSLGGNSRTLMIACVSPSDRDFMETLNTLKYANRAKNIKNRVTVNQDKSSQTITFLRREIQQLQLEIQEIKQGKRLVAEDGTEQVNDMFHENTMLQAENNNLRTRIKALQETVERLTVRNSEILAEKAMGNWIVPESGENNDITQVVKEYIKEIEELRTKLMESEEMCIQLRKQASKATRLTLSPSSATVAISGQYKIPTEADTPPSVYQVLEKARRDVKKLKKKSRAIKSINENEKESATASDNEPEKLDESETKSDRENQMETNGEISSDEEDESSSSEENEEKDIVENYSENLADLTCEISIKQKLIEELELSQRRLQQMRQHYEEKLLQLQNRIKETELERDRVLAGLSKNFPGNQSEEKVKKVRDEFERKLSTLQNELKKMQAAKKEHTQLMRNQVQYERQIKQLKNEVSDMKRQKVRLVLKMKEESQRHKESEQKRNKEIVQLKKEGRLRENQIRSLEAEKRVKETVLRRKQEEVAALRKSVKPMSDRVAGRVRSANIRVGSKRFSPKQCKLKWHKLETNINTLALNKQTVFNVEKEMERWLHDREKLSRCLEKVIKKRDRAIIERKDEPTIRDLEDQVDNMKANIDYIHENISECQTSIVQMEESKDDTDPLDIDIITSNMELEESKYLLEKLLHMAINQSIQAAQRDASIKELDARLKQVVDHNSVQQELLQHVLQQANEDLFKILMNSVDQEKGENGNESSRSDSPLDNQTVDLNISTSTLTIDSNSRKDKVRHRAVTKEDLLYAEGSSSDLMTRSMIEDKPLSVAGHRRIIVSSQSFKDTSCDMTPPQSPPVFSKRDNVFSRLTSSSSSRNRPDRGVITPYTGKAVSHGKTSPLICTHVADGHNKAVLSVAATDDVLFSGSKDRTVKIWDLHTGQEIQSMSGHPNNVNVIRYCEYTRLAFSVATAYVKVWDVRENPSKCVKTLCSSGLTNNGPVTTNTPSRVIQMPPGETQIYDIALNHYGTSLFSASGNIVRMWDLRMFHSIGKLSGGHQAAVMCLAVDDLGLDNNLVVTGSKDHSIKVFEVMEGANGIHTPKLNLDPPHYDGIQSLAINGDYLFSGSRDMCIKKWDLASQSLVQSVNQAHRDWVCALTFLPRGNLVLSSCRQGYVKLWSAENCQQMGEVRAHGAPINSLATNSICVFTASNDCTIGIWRLRSFNELSPDLDN